MGQTGAATDEIWAIEPPQELRFAGWDWDGVLVFAGGPGDTHQLSHLAALTLRILTAGPRERHALLTEIAPHLPEDEAAGLEPALAETLKELQRIGLVRRRASEAG